MKKFKNVELIIDGRKIPMNRFVREFIAGAVVGMAGALRGGAKGKNSRIELRINASTKTAKRKTAVRKTGRK